MKRFVVLLDQHTLRSPTTSSALSPLAFIIPTGSPKCWSSSELRVTGAFSIPTSSSEDKLTATGKWQSFQQYCDALISWNLVQQDLVTPHKNTDILWNCVIFTECYRTLRILYLSMSTTFWENVVDEILEKYLQLQAFIVCLYPGSFPMFPGRPPSLRPTPPCLLVYPDSSPTKLVASDGTRVTV